MEESPAELLSSLYIIWKVCNNKSTKSRRGFTMRIEFIGAAHEVTGSVIIWKSGKSMFLWTVVWNRDRIFMKTRIFR